MPAASPARIVALLASGLLAFALAGCSGSGDDDGGAAEGDGDASTSPAASAEAALASPGPADALLVDWSNARATVGGALTAVGPDSAAPPAGSTPIDVGSAQLSLSPSGRRVAIAPIESGPSAPALRILETEGWSELLSLAKPTSLVLFAWTPDSEQLFAYRAALGLDARGAVGTVRELWSIDLAAAAATRLSEVDYEPLSLHAAPDGARLYVLGREPDRFDRTFVAAYDVPGARELGRVALPGVLAGTGPLINGVAEQYDPGVAIAPDGARLYVAHATGEEITVVDLAALTVERQIAAGAPRSPLERGLAALRGLLPARASAHALAIQRRQAALSPDGRTLYVAGSSDDVCAPEATSCVHHRPLGLRAIDTATLELRAGRPDVGSFALAEDGATVLGIGFTLDEVAVREGRAGVTGLGLQVLDAATLELRAHVRPEQAFAQLVVGADGEAAYLLTADDPPRLLLFRFALDEVASEWQLPASGAVLIERAP